MSDIHDDRAAMFANLESAETQPKFWAQVADTCPRRPRPSRSGVGAGHTLRG
jgi:hypothetical protein